MKPNQHITSRPIDRLEEFCKSNPELWISKSKFFETNNESAQRDKLEQQLEQAIRDYRYACSRKSKLSDEDIERLKEAGVGGVFGYTKEIEDIASKYNYEDIEIFKKFLAFACAKYGNLDGFREHYIQSLIGDFSSRYDVGDLLKGKIPKNVSEILDKYFISGFDISNPNFQSEDSKRYARLYSEISRNQSIVFDKAKIDNAMQENLTDKEREILRLRFGIESDKVFSLEEAGRRYNVTRTRTMQIERKAIRKVRAFLGIRNKESNPENTYSQYFTLKRNVETAFIKKYFEYHDIFADSETIELDENTKTILKSTISAENLYNSDIICIEKLSLSDRAYFALKRARINDISSLTSLTQENFLKINNIGPKVAEEIIKQVHSQGLKMQWEKDREEAANADEKASIDIELIDSIQRLKDSYTILKGYKNKYEELLSIMQNKDNNDLGEK